jgi:hypothetical protein
MSSGHIVSIKTRPYLKEYFINKFGGQEPVKATNSNKLFPVIIRYLSPKPKNWKFPVSDTDTLLLELPFNDDINISHFNYLHPRNYRPINAYLYGMFYADFIEFMNEKVIYKRWQIKYAIYNFLDVHRLDCGNLEALSKIFYRYRYQDRKIGDDEIKSISRFKQVSSQIRHQFDNIND